MEASEAKRESRAGDRNVDAERNSRSKSSWNRGVFAEAAEMKCDELRGNNRMF